MGIVIPRPQMRSKERRTIEGHMKRHYELMKEYEAKGLSKAEASAAAMKDLKAGNLE